MSINTYGMDDEQYLQLFRKQSQFFFRTMREMIIGGIEEKVNLKDWPYEVIWKMYESVQYDVTEEARSIQKKQDPEGYKEHEYEPLLMPSHMELSQEIGAVNIKLDALIDYLSELLNKSKDDLTDKVD